ncbi:MULTISPECIES: ABC transporter permease subunit [unclassified Knoellia]|uniref:ABC transporter permease subunit n=1 Tax=Knoellia altitudinis TaxID=3404795 RepID=UPI0036152A98
MNTALTGLGPVVRAELAKLARRPAAWVLLGTAVALNQVFAYVIPYFAYRGDASSDFANEGSTKEQLLAGMMPGQLVANTVGAFAVFVGALALVLGALVTGTEHTGGTLKTLLTQRPGRVAVAVGQALAVVVSVGIGVVVLALTGALSAVVVALVEGQSLGWPALADLASGLGSGWAILAMWGAVGAALGSLLRAVAMPIGLGVVWILAIENLVTAVSRSTLTSLSGLRDVLPGVNSGSLLGSILPSSGGEGAPGVNTLVDGSRGLVTVLAYLAVAVVAAAFVTSRRDVA